MDRLDGMKTALQVARSGSLSAAARQLHMPVATVSRKVSELEHHLGVSLFTRTSRRLTPTTAGETYLVACASASLRTSAKPSAWHPVNTRRRSAA